MVVAGRSAGRGAASADPTGEEGGCGCATSACCGPSPVGIGLGHGDGRAEAAQAQRVLEVELLVIDLTSCARCVPTGDQLRAAVRLLTPVAEALGVELRHRETVVQSAAQARQAGLLSSPTIRLNGRDLAQDVRESRCESCGDLTENDTSIDCREWHYRGEVFSAAPLPMLIEGIMRAMLDVDAPAVVPAPLKELPENLEKYFANRKPAVRCCT